MDLKEIFGRISKTINSEYQLTQLGRHRGMKGTKREKILRNFLRDSLPQQYSLGDGEIFDSQGNVSNQVDIIICNSSMPVFKYSRYLLFYPIESVFGICEVKTKLDKEKLKEAILNIQSVKKMNLEKPSIFQGKFREKIYGAIFAYDSSDPTIIKGNIKELYNELKIPMNERVDLICVLNKFIAIGNPKEQGFDVQEKADPLFLDTKEHSLIHFVPIMVNGFNKPLSQLFNFFKYIGNLSIPIIK